MKESIAIIIGASGLVGSALLRSIIEDPHFKKVKIFGRSSVGFTHPKLEEHLIDFDELDLIKKNISGDVLFSCLGTTRGKAGSKAAQYKVDYSYQLDFARSAAENGVPAYVLVSSASADSASMFFYTRMKGELEDAIKKLSFSKIRILQPSVLEGDRKEPRSGERWGGAIINAIGKALPFVRKYRSIRGKEVARAMISSFKDQRPERILTFELDELFSL